MSSTLVALTKQVWTQITTIDKVGTVRHSLGTSQVAYVVAAVQPTVLDGSTPTSITSSIKDMFKYSGISSANFLWAYAINDDVSLVVTPETGFSTMLDLTAEYFNGTRAINTQSYIESNAKRGRQHESSVLATLAGSASRDTIFLTGALPVSLKGRVISHTGGGITASIFTGATYTGGTQFIYQNASDINPVAGLSQIIVGSTILTDGTLAFAPTYLIGNLSNQGKGGSNKIAGTENLLKPNTAYLLRIESLDNQSQEVSSFITWYEGDLDLPQ